MLKFDAPCIWYQKQPDLRRHQRNCEIEMKCRVLSWNTQGLRKAVKNNNLQRVTAKHKPDVICVQDIKGDPSQVKFLDYPIFSQYKEVWNENKSKPTSGGVMVLTKFNPKSVTLGMGSVRFTSDGTVAALTLRALPGRGLVQSKPQWEEGRMVTIEYESWNLVNVQTFNSGARLEKLEQRQEFDRDFLAYIKDLKSTTKKPTIIAGDLCIIHKPIDMTTQLGRLDKVQGASVEERKAFDELLQLGFVDSFRFKHPDLVKFTHHDQRGASRTYGMNWRWSQILVDSSISAHITEAEILDVIKSEEAAHTMELAPVFAEIGGLGETGRFEPLIKPEEIDYEKALEEEAKAKAQKAAEDDGKPKAKRARRKAFLLQLRENQLKREQEQQQQQQQQQSSVPPS